MSAPPPALSVLTRPLGLIGRQGTRAVAASVFVGLALPGLAALAKPFLLASIFALLALSFLRTDVSGMRASHRTSVLVAALVWIMGILPAAFGYLVSRIYPPQDNGLMLALVMQAAAPPIMSTPAFAALLGIDASVSLSVMVLSMLVTPLTAPVVVGAFTDGALSLDSLALAVRLAVVLVGTGVVGFTLRWWLGPPRIARLRDTLDGVNVILLLILALGLMDGVTARFMADPWLVLGMAGLTFLISAGAMLSTLALFRWAGRGQNLMLGFAAGHRNISLMIAATGAFLPDSTWLYIAVAQFPIYLLPFLLRPLARRLAPPAPRP